MWYDFLFKYKWERVYSLPIEAEISHIKQRCMLLVDYHFKKDEYKCVLRTKKGVDRNIDFDFLPSDVQEEIKTIVAKKYGEYNA